MDRKIAPVTNPEVDVTELLRYTMGDTGAVHDSMGGFRIHIYHNALFPWAEIMKILLYRGFRVFVTSKKADLFIEASV